MKCMSLTVILSPVLMWSFVETAIILPPKLKPNTPLIEKPIMQPIKVTGKTASFAVEIPVITSSGSGRNQLQLKPCRGGGNHYVIQLAKVKGNEIKWAVFRNFKQTDEGFAIGTLKPGTTYLLRAQCIFKYNAKPHSGEWSDPIEFTTLP